MNEESRNWYYRDFDKSGLRPQDSTPVTQEFVDKHVSYLYEILERSLSRDVDDGGYVDWGEILLSEIRKLRRGRNTSLSTWCEDMKVIRTAEYNCFHNFDRIEAYRSYCKQYVTPLLEEFFNQIHNFNKPDLSDLVPLAGKAIGLELRFNKDLKVYRYQPYKYICNDWRTFNPLEEDADAFFLLTELIAKYPYYSIRIYKSDVDVTAFFLHKGRQFAVKGSHAVIDSDVSKATCLAITKLAAQITMKGITP